MKRKIWAVCLVLAAAAAALFVLLRPGAPSGSTVLRLDGKAAENPLRLSEGADGLRVHITLDGTEIADLPFGEAHTVQVLQGNGDENTVLLTGSSVLMQHANCEGQDCVNMEEINRDNLETRVMSGMIICLPHRLSVEVR